MGHPIAIHTNQIEKAYFAMGCFWEPDDHFSRLKGVKNTRVGYSGGTQPNPTYEDLGDHTETIEITYDPTIVSYSNLLDQFWNNHNPTIPQNRQYRSVIFYITPKQKIQAEKSLEKQRKKHRKIHTSVELLIRFFEAEEYHQKYLQKQRRSHYLR
jgi:methionine-S-sulfoxide reductase